jgi:excisionase family DNA binding protein
MATRQPRPEAERLLTTTEVAALFGVASGTVKRWARLGIIGSITTPGGHRRYPESAVAAARTGVRR